MSLETATYIDALVASNPDAGDARTTADDHLRLIKAAIKRTFPNVAGEVSLSQGGLNLLVGVNQNVQVQLDNLREGTATARYALAARYANSASYAGYAGSAAYALFAGNAHATKFAVATGDTTLSGTTASLSFVEVTLSASGYWVGSGVLLGYVLNSALSATMQVLAGANYYPYNAGEILASVGGAPMQYQDTVAAHVIKARNVTNPLTFAGPDAVTVNFAVSVDMVANVSQSAVPVMAYLLCGFTQHNAGQQVVFKRGSYIHLERLSDSV